MCVIRGRRITSAEVKATFDYILDPANRSAKRGAFRMVARTEAPDPATFIFHLKEPYASFTTSLIRPAVGIVPANSGADFAGHPIGSGPFRFVSQSQDDDVVLESNSSYFRGAPQLLRLRFRRAHGELRNAIDLADSSGEENGEETGG